METHIQASQVEELQKMNVELKQEKEWAERRLLEYEEAMHKFNMNAREQRLVWPGLSKEQSNVGSRHLSNELPMHYLTADK